MNTKPIAIKFARWEIGSLDALKGSRVYLLRQDLNMGKKMSREDKNWLAYNLQHNSYFRLAIPLMGYKFDFSDVLCKYIVNQYGRWTEYYAPDKTSLRAMLYGRIEKILEVK